MVEDLYTKIYYIIWKYLKMYSSWFNEWNDS